LPGCIIVEGAVVAVGAVVNKEIEQITLSGEPIKK
jgi:acetyltransferase-like isoleucine patch superfamily enzyme